MLNTTEVIALSSEANGLSIDRRTFLRYGLTAAGVLVLGTIRAYAGEPRSAVVIGVDRAGDLPVLRAAASGAGEVARWLASEGFSVDLHIDGPNKEPVRLEDIYNSINRIVQQGNQQQLVIYFAGHGFISQYSEYWLLSLAPGNPNQAVSLTESVYLAGQSGIPNVVFISDACRSVSSSLRAEFVRGQVAFPNLGSISMRPTEVDQFLATRIGSPALETPLSESIKVYEGLFTSTFLDAFHNPTPEIIKEIDGQNVITNIQLKNYLEVEVPKRANSISIQKNQYPHAIIQSGESSYIGTASINNLQTSSAQKEITIQDIANYKLVKAEVLSKSIYLPDAAGSEITDAAVVTGFQQGMDSILRPVYRHVMREVVEMDDLKWLTNSGFLITEGDVVGAMASSGASVLIERRPDFRGLFVLVDLDKEQAAASVSIRFKNGCGTVLAALKDYLGRVIADDSGVSSVNYLPIPGSAKSAGFNEKAKRLFDMQAAVATSARFGAFRIEGTRVQREIESAKLIDRIHVLNYIDPTLTIYVAYAFTDAGLQPEVNSVATQLKNEIAADVFDMAMLSGKLAKPSQRPFPFVPMLSQGWSFLRVKDVQLPEPIAGLSNHLIPGLWSTFDSKGMEIIEAVLKSGMDLKFYTESA